MVSEPIDTDIVSTEAKETALNEGLTDNASDGLTAKERFELLLKEDQ